MHGVRRRKTNSQYTPGSCSGNVRGPIIEDHAKLAAGRAESADNNRRNHGLGPRLPARSKESKITHSLEWLDSSHSDTSR